uniref:NADH-ubiquinone oxidoreductase chain 4 n=1 Tax=Aurelia limbata TaxID=184213 RepID=A0A6G6CG65_9CNID|nr:NADH dehydrogenase subunit 4 [Aurelia limbata]QID91290.1 NADH dehydrogenase subunit 4 [Aurelia limbata]
MILIISIVLIISILLTMLVGNSNPLMAKKIALGFSFLVLWLSIILWIDHSTNSLFYSNIMIGWLDTISLSTDWGSIYFGVDQLSLPFILLTGILTPICIIISWNSITYLIKEFLVFLLMIHLLLVGVFTSLNLLLFYIMFEGILIPMFLMIGIWGSRKEKERAAFYFFFFTLAGSLFMLIGIFTIYKYTGTLDYTLLSLQSIPYELQFWVFIGFFLSLAVKIPKIPFHIWLPQAHVEAPVAGSVLLAGVLLKLGGYGFLRFSWTLFPAASQYFSPIIILLGSVAVIYASLSTCRQTDAKKLVAYSSVAHMGLVTIAIFSRTSEGLVAAIILMLAHGFISSGLFITVTNLYDRFHTRTIRYYKGVVYTMPVYSTLFFLLILANIAFPVSMNFIGEFMSILSAFQFSLLAILCPLAGMILSGAYSLLFYNKISFGYPSSFLQFARDINRRELWPPLILIVLAIVLGLAPTCLDITLCLPYIY